jgi:hypothetical protein
MKILSDWDGDLLCGENGMVRIKAKGQTMELEEGLYNPKSASS